MTQPRYVVDGPRWYRTQIRSKGPFKALLPPIVLGAAALVLLNVFESRLTGGAGLVLGFLAAPALPALGAPFSDSSTYPIAVGISAALWILVGVVAARWATRDPMASWSDFWRMYRWLAAGIWLGALTSLAVARFVLDRELI